MTNTEPFSITVNSKLIPRPEPSTYFRDIGIRAVAAAVRYQCLAVGDEVPGKQAEAAPPR